MIGTLESQSHEIETEYQEESVDASGERYDIKLASGITAGSRDFTLEGRRKHRPNLSRRSTANSGRGARIVTF